MFRHAYAIISLIVLQKVTSFQYFFNSLTSVPLYCNVLRHIVDNLFILYILYLYHVLLITLLN